MTEKTIQFELVSPERVMASEPSVMVTVPATEGDIGVLEGHAPFLSSIRPGVVSVHRPDGSARQVFVAGGFVDVSPQLCSVLAEEAVNVEDLDRAAIEHSLRQLHETLAAEKDDPARAASLEKKIQVEQARLRAATPSTR